MRFSWSADPAADCQKNCGWISAVGVITGETADAFDEFARGRDLAGATIVLDSGGGSVLDAIKLGRRWRDIGLFTTVGRTVSSSGTKAVRINPQAYCESMCVFLLLSGAKRYVPPEAHVRVHQIWMGDRAEDAKAASYSAQDLMIVQRDVGRLTKYTFEMGGSGDLLALALSVPPWEPLRELTPGELRLSKVTNVDALEEMLKLPEPVFMSLAPDKPIQERFAADNTVAPKKTAEAGVHARADAQ
jgi:hypothetical protein